MSRSPWGLAFFASCNSPGFNGLTFGGQGRRAGLGRRTGYSEIGMKKPEIARRLARQSGVSPAEAADRLDRVVREILANLRRGREVPLPGLGTFVPGPHGKLTFHQQGGGK